MLISFAISIALLVIAFYLGVITAKFMFKEPKQTTEEPMQFTMKSDLKDYL